MEPKVPEGLACPAFRLPGSQVTRPPESLGPATRRTGAYRDGTLTRWTRAASRRRTLRSILVYVTTHHGASIAEPRGCPRGRAESRLQGASGCALKNSTTFAEAQGG